MPRFFIDRPIFAWVLAILVMMAGGLALSILPVAQYPDIGLPQITLRAMYPGASAKTVEDTVTQVIEQQMTGLDNLLYMSSTSDSSGLASITFSFQTGTDIDMAQVQVQNKLQLALPLLPDEVQRQGISITKAAMNFLIIVGFISEDGSMDEADIGDYIATHLKDPMSRIPGVGSTNLTGAQYAMRIWCDPLKFEQFQLNPSDVIAAVREQNAQSTGGQIGANPALPGQEINIAINAASRLQSAREFENIFLRALPDGSSLLLKDVARIELGSESYASSAFYNGKPAVGLQFKLAPGANALDTAKAIKARVEALKPFFPPGLQAIYPYDSTLFVNLSIKAVFTTLGEAIVLVFLVMYLFLQNFRATIIPTVAIPVVLLGVFAVLAAAGFSINTLTMFGLVLAIGLLVDDAIIVVENVERLMREEGLSAREASKKSMDQIAGALVGVALVISAVFVPMAFLGGSIGVVFRQFSITLTASMLFSMLVALILSPALCATLLGPHRTRKGLFLHFNTGFEHLTQAYGRSVQHMLGRPVRYVLLFSCGVALMIVLFLRLPTSFLPDEDQGVLFSLVQLPAGASSERTRAVLDQLGAYMLNEEKEAIEGVLTVSGESFSGRGQNTGMAFVRMRNWEERRSPANHVHAVAGRIMQRFGGLPEARIFAFAPPPVMELGTAAGFDFQLTDPGGQGHEALMNARNQMLGMASTHPDIKYIRPNGLDEVEQYDLRIDLPKALALGLNKGDIDAALGAYWGSVYVNDFLDRGRTKKVYLQADAPYRMQASDLNNYFLRTRYGQMAPVTEFVTMHSRMGSPRLERYNGVPSVELLGEAAPGKTSGHAMAAMEELMTQLPPGFDFSWTALSLQEKLAGTNELFLYAVSLAVVFLCLAALYESWSIPLAVLFVVPTGVFGALAAAFYFGLSNDVYFQIGMLTIAGLSAKNSVLIAEFARSLRSQGLSPAQAALVAARTRFRPIVMTSLAFGLGVVPLAMSAGAGSGAQNAIGRIVFFGVLSATGLGVVYAPLFTLLFSRTGAHEKI